MNRDQGGEGGSYASLPWAAMLHSCCLLGARLEVSVGHVENGKAADRIRHVVGIVRVGRVARWATFCGLGPLAGHLLS